MATREHPASSPDGLGTHMVLFAEFELNETSGWWFGMTAVVAQIICLWNGKPKFSFAVPNRGEGAGLDSASPTPKEVVNSVTVDNIDYMFSAEQTPDLAKEVVWEVMSGACRLFLPHATHLNAASMGSDWEVDLLPEAYFHAWVLFEAFES